VWKDQKDVWILYNHTSPLNAATLDRWDDAAHKVAIGCPQAVHDYLFKARSVDVSNQLHYSYPTGRKANRAWPRLTWWLIDISIVNAFNLWSIGKESPKQFDFREQLMHAHGEDIRIQSGGSARQAEETTCPLRLSRTIIWSTHSNSETVPTAATSLTDV
jgi:hypothetical protein